MRYFLVFLSVAACLCSCTGPAEMRTASGSVWGTVYHIKYASDTDLSDSIVSVMHCVDMSLSPFQKQSLVSAINAGDDIEADSMFIDVLNLSKAVWSVSDGAFDPTLAPLINLWGFGYSDGATDRPRAGQIDSVLAYVGINECRIGADRRVVKKSPHTEFNFSAIAKGYGVDRIADMLDRNGCPAYMVEVGGEVRLKGDGPSGHLWRIQIDAPLVEDGVLSHTGLQTLTLSDVGIATSGNYRNHRTTSEGVVGHTLDTRTGYPVATEVLSATVIAENTALADALATAIMAMPADKGIAMIERLEGVEALVVIGDTDDSYLIVKTRGFDRYIRSEHGQ